MIVVLLTGGGGYPAPVSESAIILFALVVLAIWYAIPLRDVEPDGAPSERWGLTRSSAFDRWALYGVAALLAITALQLFPLPSDLWQGFPGRASVAQSLALIDADGGWRPLSIAPQRTLIAFLSLIPPITIFLVTRHLDMRWRSYSVAAVAAAAILSGILGAVQQGADPNGLLRPFDAPNLAFATGLFANRNSAGDLLVLGIVAAAAVFVHSAKSGRIAASTLALGATILFLVLSVFLTGSRAGALLLLVAVPIAVLMVAPRSRWPRMAWKSIAAVALAIGLVAYLLHDNVVLEQTWARFWQDQEQRPAIWRDTTVAIGRYFPFGSGLGTFVPAFTAVERLSSVDASFPNRAHNDYLEFALETGVLGVVLLLIAIGAIAARGIELLRAKASGISRSQTLFALTTLVILALHSIVDYPMRSMSLACVAALCVGLLARVPDRGLRTNDRRSS